MACVPCYFYCLVAGSDFYTFELINCVDTGLEQNQMKGMNYVVVDSVRSWKWQNVPKTQRVAEIHSSSINILNVGNY